VNRKTISISLYAEGDNVAFYTFTFDGEEHSETKKFDSKYRRGDFIKEYQDILLAISIIGDHTSDKIHFRPCSKKEDNVMALPGKDDENQEIKKGRLAEGDLRVLRLYCIVLTKNIVILGNGDIKSTQKYNDDTTLDEYVNVLVAIDNKLKDKGFSIDGKKINGNLKFEIEWE
jgi:hypothetical protein